MNNTNIISPSIVENIPSFIRLEHPSFVAFLETYFEWLENQGAYLRNTLDLSDVNNIDRTFDEFIESFKYQYLNDFPEQLAISQTTGKPVDPRKLIKNIKSFYEAKGTEKSYQLLFRILYDTNVDFYYPKVDILRASDGKWIQRKSIRVTSSTGPSILNSVGKKIYQVINGAVTASAIVNESSRYQLGLFEVTELFLSGINGSFVANVPLYFEVDGTTLNERKVYSIITNITTTSDGLNYRIGDKVIFTNASGDSGQNASAKVSQVSALGAIQKITIDNFGVNYQTAPTITINSNTGSGFAGTCSIGALCNFEGYYANNDGKLSSNKVIQDNHYYQNYSYVLKTEVTIDKYRNVIKRLIHPAGMAFFGQVLIKRCAESAIDTSCNLISYEVPLIGHYLPYNFRTYDNLQNWFRIGDTAYGYDHIVHDPIIIGATGNPISSGILFTQGITLASTSNFEGADPFWIVYSHPNTKITKKSLARIYYHQLPDFLGTTGSTGEWEEWIYSKRKVESNGTTSERSNWITGFTAGDAYQYALLEYGLTSEFRKITINSFFTMPTSEEFVC